MRYLLANLFQEQTETGIEQSLDHIRWQGGTNKEYIRRYQRATTDDGYRGSAQLPDRKAHVMRFPWVSRAKL